MCEYATETGHLQRHVKIEHIDSENDDPLDKSKTTETHLEVKIEVKRENVDPGDSSLSPEKGNETFPEGWKVRPDKNKMQDPINGIGEIELEPPIEMNMIQINMDKNAEPGKFQEQKSEVTDYDNSSPILKHENPRFACWKCGFITDSSRTLTRHASMVHRVEVTEKPPNKVGIEEEDVCAGILESGQDNQHMTQNHDSPEPYAKFNPNGGEDVQCDLCTYATSRIGNMRKHMLADHQGVSLPCNYKAPDKDSQLRHTRGWHEGIRYSCDFCPYSATQKRILKKHQKIEHRENYYSCIYCNHKADWKDSLVKHLQIHHGDCMNIQSMKFNELFSPHNAFNINDFIQKEKIAKLRQSCDSFCVHNL